MHITYRMIKWIHNFIREISPEPKKAGTILLVLLASASVPYKASSAQLVLVLLALGGMLAIFGFLRWPGLGILTIPLSGMFIHFNGPGGINATIVLVALLLALWIGKFVIFQRKTKIRTSPLMISVFILILANTLSLCMGQIRWFSFANSARLEVQLGGYAVHVLSFGAFMLVAHQIKHVRWLQRLVWGFIIIGAIYTGSLLIPQTYGLIHTLMTNMRGLFWIWLVALTYSQALFNKDLHPTWRIILLVVILTILYLLFVIKFKSKSGWFPVFVVLWVITALWSWRLGTVLLIGGIFATLSLLPQVFSSEDYSLATRLEALPILYKIWRVSPFFGVGFANYYWYTSLFPIRGYYVSFNSHNNYADILVQTGVLGLVLYIWLLSKIGSLAWTLRKHIQDGFSIAYVNGAIGGLVGMILVGFLGDWVLPFVYNIGLRGFRSSILGWLFLGGLVALQQILNLRLETLRNNPQIASHNL